MAKAKDASDALVRLRFRRSTTIGDRVFAANSVDTLEASDEVWDVVNRGDADLDPPAGSPGQVRVEDIPDELTQAPAPPVAPVVAAEPARPAAAPASPAAATAPAADYDAMTVEDLHHEATKRNLEGRSGLDKAGLVKALQKDDQGKTRRK